MAANAHFLLNDREATTNASAGTLVLDFLRRSERLTGTKEGCKEGDCGACTVLIGELVGETVRYKPVTSCLMPVGELHGKHLVTIEGLNLPALTPVQQAIVDSGGTQCGFCTPGIVLSMTALLLNGVGTISPESLKYALSGHLCRCTGYRSLKACAPLLQNRVGENHGVEALISEGFLPLYFRDIYQRLRRIPPPPELEKFRPTDVIIAGGTDIYVQQGEDLPAARVNVLNLFPEMQGISRDNGNLRVGALTTFEEFAEHPAVREIIPSIQDYMFLIASWQIRNRATLGGNVINASPIGDMTILLLALQAQLVLQGSNGRRTLPITEFYQGYKRLAKADDEILAEIVVPAPAATTKINFEKVSKRKCLDIASVNSAMKARIVNGRFAEVGLAVGGVAPVPLYLKETCEFLTGNTLELQTVRSSLQVAQQEISPISDVRGSADYKRLLARQLLIAHFTKLLPEQINVRDFYEAH